MSNKFNYYDLLKQFKMIKRIGSSKILGLLPGMKQVREAAKNMDDKQFEFMEAIIGSMTDEERKNPELIEKSSKRRERIAKGSGRSVTEVNNLRKTLERQKQVAKQMAGMSEEDMKAMQRKMQNGGGAPVQGSVAPKSVYKRK